MPDHPRRIVTGHDGDGRSIILADGATSTIVNPGDIPGLHLNEMWVTDRTPASNAGDADAADRPASLTPPPGGSVFRVVDLPPDEVRFGAAADTAAMTAPTTPTPGAGRAVRRAIPASTRPIRSTTRSCSRARSTP